jgi:signal transduction histidine kinase
VTCEPAAEGAVVTVTDEGRGIAAEDLSKVMSAGFTTKESGHGLGLHSFAVFLSASGGQLKVESAGLGHGATVSAQIHNA